jgi:predicted DNA-binding ArsR family transcriptional regulator
MSDKSVKTKQPKPEKRARVDWDAVERDHRTGKYTKRELGERYGISHTAINKRANQYCWTQDLSDAIQKATQAKLALQAKVAEREKQSASAVSTVVSTAVSKSGLQQDVETIDLASDVNTAVILGHRKGLIEITSVRNVLLAHVAQTAASLPDLADIIEMVRKPDENGIDRANDALRKALGRSALIDDLKKLAEIDEKVRKGEREAFSIGDAGDDTGTKPVKRVVLDFVDAVTK